MMGGTDGGWSWVLFLWLAGLCSVRLKATGLLMGGAVCPHPVGCLAWGFSALETIVSEVGLMATSGRAQVNEYSPELFLWVTLSLHWAPAALHLFRSPSNTTWWVWLNLFGVIAFSTGSWCAWDLVCALNKWNLCVAQSYVTPVIKSC